ncbi:MAG: rhodanese-like domain-containing protein [Chitinophagales bacterium]|nr:rhodanese-like domain-containing protein [Chitinophagales bacterium]MDW8418532.1 rhodanese-like domain-containing protein [Chitinophagales bacterium]
MGFIQKLFGLTTKTDTRLEDALNNGAMLIDVRTPAEFKQGSVPGAINIPVEVIAEQTNRIPRHQPVVVFCRSGNRSERAKNILETKGYKNVLNGGSWQNVAQLLQNKLSQ